MTWQTAFLYPGQGSQTPNFLHELPEHAAVHATFQEVKQTLDLDPNYLDTATALRSTVAVQLTTLIAGVAYTRILASRQALPDVVAGLSVGAFTAAVACGVLDFPDALRLVRLRAEAMDQAYGQQGGFGMLAILGLREAAVQALIEATTRTTAAPLYLASVNSPTEIILAGADAALVAAAETASRSGGRARRLRVNVPSHGPLLDKVSVRLQEAMVGVHVHPPRVPYISNSRARALSNGGDVARDLALNVSHTVRWHESVTLLYELGIRVFIEAPPGHALTNLVQSEFPDVRAFAAAAVGLESVVHVTASKH